MEVMGFIFGLGGLSFAIISWGLIATLKKEFEDLKNNLVKSGVIKVQNDINNK